MRESLRNKIVFIGPMGGGVVPTNGASIKNYYILKRLKDLGYNIISVDTEKWRTNPFVLLKLLIVVVLHPLSIYTISANSISTYRLLMLLNHISPQRDIIYWVIGGSIANWIKTGKVKKKVYRIVRLFIVEGDSMKRILGECGFDNVITLPNFKKIDYIPIKPNRGNVLKFVFLSRIIEQKGCKYIIKATEILNIKYKERFVVDFYGSIGDEYVTFLKDISFISNMSYKGFLDLRSFQNYDILSSYDVMLFPTFWEGEGFPGIMIDAFICGMPIIATDWNMNKDILQDGKTGFLVRPQNVEDLVAVMEKVITVPTILDGMITNCQKEAMNYHTNNVLNEGILHHILY